MAKPRYELHFAHAAELDVAAIIRWTLDGFGEEATYRYNALLQQAFTDIAQDPERPGARRRPEFVPGVLTYHVALSRKRARAPHGPVRKPRHLVVYRLSGRVIEVLRVLHDARDIGRHVPKQYLPGPEGLEEK